MRGFCKEQEYRILETEKGRLAVHAARCKPDLVIASDEMNDMSYIQLYEILRNSDCSAPMIVISENSEVLAEIEILEAGVSDYIIIPFKKAETLARIRRVLQRGRCASDPPAQFSSGELHVDLISRRVLLAEAPVSLTPKEIDLLELLILNAGTVLSQDYLCMRLWNKQVNKQHIRHYIQRIRAKIEKTSKEPRFIETVPGVGYRFINPDK